MSSQQDSSPQQAPSYRVGDVVNEHVFTGVAWVPVAHFAPQFGTPVAEGSGAEPIRPAAPASAAAQSRLVPSRVQPVYAGAPVKPGMALSTKVVLAVLGLVVGVFVLGIAAAIAIPVFLNSSNKGYEAAVQSDLRNAATAAETYWTTNGTPPVDAQVLDDYGWFPAVGVTIMLAASSPGGYCLEGTHANLPGLVWSFASDTGLAEGACF
jgi:type IV pilus assembly protein PilA